MLEITNPRQTVIVSCRLHKENSYTGDVDDIDNILAVDWHMPVCFTPGYYAISLGKNRYSCELIKESEVFVVNFMDVSYSKAVDKCGRITGRLKNKFSECGLTKEEADSVDCCRIHESLAYLECEVTNTMEIGDHVLFIGKILGKGHKKDGKRLFHKLHGNYGMVE